MLSYIYLGHSCDIFLILDFQLETKSGRKYQETIYKGNLIIDSLKEISHWESWIVLPNIFDKCEYSYTIVDHYQMALLYYSLSTVQKDGHPIPIP